MFKAIVFVLFASGLLVAGALLAAPIVPRDDAEVIETLPAAGDRADERRLRRQLAARPRGAQAAVAMARRHLGQAREQGDPRLAGQALALLQAWPDPATAPSEVLLMQATVEQYLHEFDAAASKVERLVKREPRDAQAWLTLATVRRVQGRYDESDAACRGLAGLGADLYATACHAENEGLRGHADTARTALTRLIATPRLPPETVNWLLTTLAELEARTGNIAPAQTAYRAALEALPDAYTALSYADFLIAEGRDTEALATLQGERRTDAVLLRLAIAGTRAKSPDADRDAAEMRARIALANERPDAQILHAREQAMFALWVDAEPRRALALARANVGQQREPLDLLVLAQAARACNDATALREAKRLRSAMGLGDRRLDALL